jgi:hypothetical protein
MDRTTRPLQSPWDLHTGHQSEAGVCKLCCPKPPGKINHAQEHLQVLDGDGLPPLDWVGLDSSGRHVVAQEADLAGPPHALLSVDDQAVLLQMVEELPEVFLVVLACYQTVVNEVEDHLHLLSHPVHLPLEGGTGVPQPKMHLKVLKQAKHHIIQTALTHGQRLCCVSSAK